MNASLFAPPQRIDAEVHSEIPASLRKARMEHGHSKTGRSIPAHGCFLEGPSFDREGNLYVTDIPYGRVFRISPAGTWDVVVEYEGEPNGLKIHRDGRIFVADYRNGLMLLDEKRGTVEPLLTHYNGDRFRGLNDLCFADNGDLYFTDQGQTGLNDPHGRVYRLRETGRLELVADYIPSPNGIVLNPANSIVYVAVTRANAIWRMPLLPDGTASRVGLYLQLSGGRGPDGIAVDEDGGLAVAHPEMGCVWIFNGRGEPTHRVQSPRSTMVTNIAYGGPDRRTLYIVDSEGGFVHRATLPVAGRAMYSHR